MKLYRAYYLLCLLLPMELFCVEQEVKSAPFYKKISSNNLFKALMGSETVKYRSKLPNGNRRYGQEILAAFDHGHDITPILKRCNREAAFAGAFNEAIESLPNGHSISLEERARLYNVAYEHGRMDQEESWHKWNMRGIMVAAGAGTFAAGLCAPFLAHKARECLAATPIIAWLIPSVKPKKDGQ